MASARVVYDPCYVLIPPIRLPPVRKEAEHQLPVAFDLNAVAGTDGLTGALSRAAAGAVRPPGAVITRVCVPV
jgi:hypothetical protein